MAKEQQNFSRREFIAATGKVVGGAIIATSLSPVLAQGTPGVQKRLVLVGTGIRGIGMYGRKLLRDYGDYVKFVGLCDINLGRLAYAREYIGADCPVFTDFEQMMQETSPEILIVTTVDSVHHEYIIRGLELGVTVISEKPMTTDELKARAILEAERRTGNKLIVTFNYRYSPHRTKIKELLMTNAIGKVTSVDLHWYLDTEHGPRYFRRWHGLREKGGTLLVHKATHHFDLLNWWLDSDPEEVFGYGSLEFFGKNNAYRSEKCRGCDHQEKCELFWDITKKKKYLKLYVENEKYDGYIRDACVWRKEIDIYDKMAVLIKYANGVQVTYSLTTYSPYEGYRIAFNGTKGRLEAWIHEKQSWPMAEYDELRLTRNFGDTQVIRISNSEEGHGGGDVRLLDKLFKDPNMPDPLKRSAGTRDGTMSLLIGVAARKSIDTGTSVKLADLTEIKLEAKRPV